MAPSDDASVANDLYTLLNIPATATESEIRRAYRKTSLLYHPDKVTPTPETLDKFQSLQHALAILTDPTERSKYDATRQAKLRRAAEHAAMDTRRRKMTEDLEKREAEGRLSEVNGVKRKMTDRELEIQRIQAENRKRREEAMAKRIEEIRKAEVVEETPSDNIERSVKVRWVKQGDGLDIDDVVLGEMFPTGEVDHVVLLKDKKRKIDGKDKKVVMGTAVLIFKSLAVAKKVVAKGKTDELESVTWAVDKEQDIEPV